MTRNNEFTGSPLGLSGGTTGCAELKPHFQESQPKLYRQSAGRILDRPERTGQPVETGQITLKGNSAQL